MKKTQVLAELAKRKRELVGEIDALQARLAAIEETEMLLATPTAQPAKKRRPPRKAKQNGPAEHDHEADEAQQSLSGL